MISAAKLTCIILMCFFCSAHASGPQKFSFAGLLWGDSYQEFDRKISSSGFAIIDEKNNMESRSVTYKSFKGEVSGNAFSGVAYFSTGRLISIGLLFPCDSSYNAKKPWMKVEREILELLETKYGKTPTLGAPDYAKQWNGLNGEILKMYTSKTGNAITSSIYVHVQYLSAEAGRLKRDAEEKYKSEKLERERLRQIEVRKQAEKM